MRKTSRSRRWRDRLTAVVAGLGAVALTAGFLVVGVSSPVSAESGTPGNNGTVKVHEEGTPSGEEDNDPKVCVFNIEGFGFDSGQQLMIRFDVQGGSRPIGAPAGPYGPYTANDDGYFATPYFTNLANGTYKSTALGKDTPDGDYNVDLKAKSKVFKAECAALAQPLTVTKTAAGTFARTVTWDLEKSVDDASHSGVAGQVAGSSVWTVEVDKTERLSNFAVSGQITIRNPNAFEVPVTVVDVLQDDTAATVDCDPVTAGSQPEGTVPAATHVAGQLTCTYTASPSSASATANTVTVTSMREGVQGATATTTLPWTETLSGADSGTLRDDRFEFSQEIAADTAKTFPEQFVCPADPGLYQDGMYSFTETNTATFGGMSDSAQVKVTCSSRTPPPPPPPPTGTLEWLKVDEAGDPLAGATFEVCLTGGTCVTVVDDTAPDVNADDGEFELRNLALGTYTITEVEAPEGYVRDIGSETVVLTAGSPANTGDAVPEFVNVEEEDEAVYGDLGWLKVDEQDELLGGATFEVCRAVGINRDDIDDCLTVTDNTWPDTDTDAGEFALNDVPLGVWTIEETKAPAGYEMADETERVILTEADPSNIGEDGVPAFVNVLAEVDEAEEPEVLPAEEERPKPAQPAPVVQPDEVKGTEAAVPTSVDAGLAGPTGSGGSITPLGQSLMAAGLVLMALAGAMKAGRRERGFHEA